MSHPDTSKCKACEGSGRVTRWNGSYRMTKICSTCGGTGRTQNHKPKKLK